MLQSHLFSVIFFVFCWHDFRVSMANYKTRVARSFYRNCYLIILLFCFTIFFYYIFLAVAVIFILFSL